jgi:hypothetical protein
VSVGILVELGESEVGDLGSAVVQEDIGSLEVAVRDAHLPQVLEAQVDVEHELGEFCVGKTLALEAFLEVALAAELRDDVAVAVGEEGLVEPDHVGVTHLLQDADLLEDELLEVLGLERVQRDDLDGHGLFWVGQGVRVTVLRPR